MLSTFLKHEFKAFWRSKNVGKNLAVQIFMGLMILYLLACVAFAGFFLDKIISKTLPHDPILYSFCGLILMYFIWELFARLQLQELPTLRVQPYLQLPIKRDTLIRYLSVTALFSVFNLWPVVLLFPFIFKVILPQSGVLAALGFAVAVLALSVFNNYLALYVKRRANLNGWVFFIAMGVLCLITLADFMWHLISIRGISYSFFGHLINQPALMLLPVLMAAAVYLVNFNYLKQNLYLEELSTKRNKLKASTDYPLLSYFGPAGDLVANEIKLIMRNKRPRSAFVMSLFFLCYGLFFYPNPGMKDNEVFKVFVGMFMTGLFTTSYGQFMFSWQAAHFDGLMVSKIKFADFLKGKYLLLTAVSTMALILTTPYVYFGWRVLLIHFVMYLWNLGVNVNIVLYFANRNARRIDLSKGASFNWEGVGGTQMLLSFLLMLPPLGIYWLFSVFGYPDAALAAMGLIGLISALCRDYWIQFLEADFHRQKFNVLEGFRNKQ
ncbi:MAG: DUF5687 family protein [Bacteroidota bacterium]